MRFESKLKPERGEPERKKEGSLKETVKVLRALMEDERFTEDLEIINARALHYWEQVVKDLPGEIEKAKQNGENEIQIRWPFGDDKFDRALEHLVFEYCDKNGLTTSHPHAIEFVDAGEREDGVAIQW